MPDLSHLHTLARGMTAADWCDAFVRFAATGDNPLDLPPFPSESAQRITNSQANAETMRGAADFYRILDETLADHPAASGRLLDFGAGWGRITRLLLRSLPSESIIAVDVDERLVDAGNAMLPGIDFLQIQSGKALPFRDGSFSAVIAWYMPRPVDGPITESQCCRTLTLGSTGDGIFPPSAHARITGRTCMWRRRRAEGGVGDAT